MLVVELLKQLFINLQETNEKAISPEYDLAYMALLNEKDEQEENIISPQQQQDIISPQLDVVLPEQQDVNLPQQDFTLSTSSSTQNVILSQNESIDTETIDSIPDTEMLNDNESFINMSDKDIDLEYRRTSFTSLPPNSPPPSYNDIIPIDEDEKSHFEDDVKKPLEIPKVKERPSVDTMMFGKQQDVTGNIYYYYYE